MAQITPNSQVWLCNNVPLDPNYDNTMTFTTGIGTNRTWDYNAQLNYFMGKSVFSTNKFSVVRERNGVLRMTGMKENQFSMYNINYMVFTNTNFDNKYFYAFITKIQYINPGTTFIYFVLDEIQTWIGELQFMESNIEREHVEDDTVFKNIEDEGIPIQDRLGYGDIINFYDCIGQKMVVLGTTESVIDITTKSEEVYYSCLRYYPNYNNLLGNGGIFRYKITNIKCYENTVGDDEYPGSFTGGDTGEGYFNIPYNYNLIKFTATMEIYEVPLLGTVGEWNTYAVSNVKGERTPGTAEFTFSADS